MGVEAAMNPVKHRASRTFPRAVVPPHVLWLLSLPWILGFAHAQMSNPSEQVQAPPALRLPRGSTTGEFDQPDLEMERTRLRALNIERQKSLVSDTNRLLTLVNEFNEETTRGNAGSLTPGQLRKLAEIEKLARNVRVKMSTSVGDLPVFRPPIFPGH